MALVVMAESWVRVPTSDWNPSKRPAHELPCEPMGLCGLPFRNPGQCARGWRRLSIGVVHSVDGESRGQVRPLSGSYRDL